MGAKFWIGFMAAVVGLGIAALLIFLLIDAAWYRWGFLGGCLALAVVLLVIAWIMDRRTAKRYDEDVEAV
jgi:uncharacterized membrane protein